MPRKVILLVFFGLISSSIFASIKEEIAKSIVRVHSGTKYSTGFFWNNGNTVLTTLHSLSSLNNVEVYVPQLRAWKNARVSKVYKSGDIVSLTISGYYSDSYLSNKYFFKPPVDTRVFTIGYNSGSPSYIDRDFSVGLLQGNTLGDLLPASAKHEIDILGFPSTNLDVTYLKGNLLHGFSGSPIVDLNGKLVGIADGGLENGAAGISWCINSTHITKLENSNESLPVLNQSRINTLFATEEYEENDYDNLEVNINDFTFKKVKTRTFQELDRTGYYSTYKEMGLYQLITMFNQSGINYNNFEFDVYVEQTTGATIVIPVGLELTTTNNFITAYSSDYNFSYLIRLENTYNTQQTSVQFENQAGYYTYFGNWVQDFRLSFSFPLVRPDNVIINRKAFLSSDGTKYAFEVLAGKQTTFLGMFVFIQNHTNL